MKLPITPADIEQEFIDLFTDNLTRGENLVAQFGYTNIVVTNFHLLIDEPGKLIQKVYISNLRDIEYSSGVLMLHQQVGDTIEIDLTDIKEVSE